MNRLIEKMKFRLNGGTLHKWGTVFLLAGALGNVIQSRVLGVGTISNEQLLGMMQENPAVMHLATAALAFQLLEVCAVPVFSFLLVEGTVHTSSFRKYLLRVSLLAMVCQIPYSLAGKGLNPVCSLVMSQIMLYFFRRFPGKKVGHLAIKAFAIAGTFLWSNILGIPHGAACVIITAVLWVLRDKVYFRMFGGCMAMVCCSVFSPLYMAAALSFLILYFYDGTPGEGDRIKRYICYPLILLISELLMM